MSDPAQPPYGAQPERTSLAWRRTALGLVVAALVSARLLAPREGVWLIVAVGAGLAVSVALLIAASRRYTRETSTPGDGRLLAVCALITVLIGAGALWFVL